MMQKILRQLNIKAQCDSMGVGVFSCPPFIFLIMGIVVIGSVVSTYVLAQVFVEPEIAAAIVLFLSAFLIIVSFAIVRAFEKVVETKQKEAEEAKKLIDLKDQFVLVAAHELRVPVNAIKWGLETLNLKGKDQEMLNVMRESNERLLDLVDDILEASRTEGKRIKAKISEVSLRQIAGEAAEEVKKSAHGKEAIIRNEVPESIPECLADPTRLKEVLINLLTNAVKYNKNNGEIRITAEEKDGECAVHVSDKGIGIKREYFGSVFTKFWRAIENKESIEGTGLGLFIAKQLIELMGGRIWFESEFGKGSTFSFSLPKARGQLHL